MFYREVRPRESLGGWIRCFWILRAGATSGNAARERGEGEGVLPDGSPELVLNLGDPFVRFDGGGRPTVQPGVMLVGTITRPMVIGPSGAIDLLGVRFAPAGAHALTGLPMHRITDGFLDLEALDPAWRDLREDVGSEPDDHRRRALLEARLERRLLSAGGTGAVAAAASVLRTSAGAASVDEVARSVGLSARQLGRRFGTEVGVGPKTLARIFRFQRFLGLATGSGDISMVRAALQAGYFDQSHLIRDFRELAGRTPSSFFAAGHALADRFAEADLNRRRRST